MTLFRKSMVVVLTGVLVIAIALALPLPLVFGEGGARRDVVRHELERNAKIMDMLYLVEFEATQAGAPTSREQTEVTEFVRALPASSIIQWKVTPLETFAHRADIEKKVVQGLRAQK